MLDRLHRRCRSRVATCDPSGDDNSTFSILDLSDLAKPREVKTVKSPAAGPNPVFTSGAGHHWNIDGAGIAWHTGSGGAAAFDISDPLNPKLLTGTDPNGTASPYNDFIHHNSQRPNARAFAPGRAVDVANGNVVLVTEEDYANDGDEVACDRAGTFQTWELVDLDGDAYRAANPDAEPNKGTMRVLDAINAPHEGGGGLTTRPAPCGRRRAAEVQQLRPVDDRAHRDPAGCSGRPATARRSRPAPGRT